MIAYKFCATGARSPFTGYVWPAPGSTWSVVGSPLVTCANGWHACRTADLPYWLADELWEVELEGAVLEADTSVVAERARLRRRVAGWPDPVARELAVACARRARDIAVRELSLAGAGRTLAVLGGWESLDELAGAVALGDMVDDEPARMIVQYTGDTASYALEGGYAEAAYIAAFAAEHASPEPGQRLSRDVTAFDVERAWQARWLAARLDLMSS